MNSWSRALALVFAAGCAGAVANSFTVWLFGALSITTMLGVAISPSVTPAWLYPRIVWGGLWGALFLLPFMRRSPLWQGLLYSLGPSLVQLLIVFPFKADKGWLGLDLGTLTPLFVLFFNAVWGLKTAYFLRRIRGTKD